MRHRGFTLIEMLILVAVVAIIAIVAYPMLGRRRGTIDHVPVCPTNLKQFGMAIQQYTQDNGRKFPRVAVNPITDSNSRLGNPYGWADAIYPYINDVNVYQCPGEGNRNEGTAMQNGFTDYWMNARLSGFADVNLRNPDVVVLGEGNDGEEITDARYAKRNLPFDWLQNKNSPAYRHNGGASYLFADGHVRFIPANPALNLTFRPTLKPGG